MGFIKLYTYFVALSLAAGVLAYRRSFPLYLKWLVPFLFITLVTEVYGSYLSSIDRNNLVIYNFFSAFEFCFYLFLIILIIRSPKVKSIIWISIALYAVAALINIFFIQGVSVFHTGSYAAGCLIVVIFCVYYFYELFRFPESGRLAQNPAFWICAGLLFFYCCGFPLYALMNVWSKNVQGLVYNNFEFITSILNIFLYSLFMIAFLCSRTRNYTSSSS